MATTPDEILRQQRTATRLDPSGARSTVYQKPAGQVPRGVVTPGLDPMPARAQTIQYPSSTANPVTRAAFEARPTVAPEVSQRMAQRLAPRQMPPGATVQVDPTGTARVNPLNSDAPRSIGQIRGASAPASAGSVTGKVGRLTQAVPGRIAQAAGTVGRMGVGVAGLSQISKGANQMTGAQEGGMLEGAARTAAGAAALTPASVLPKVLRGAGPIGAVASGSLLATDLMGLPATGLSPHALGMRAVEAVQNHPTGNRILNAARSALGLPTAEPAKTLSDLIVGDRGGAPSAIPSAHAATPEQAAPAAPDAAQWFGTPDAAAANVARPGPIAAAARSGGAVARPASRFAGERTAQLQRMAGAELGASRAVARPAVAEVVADDPGGGGIQVLGPGDGYAGMRQTAPGVYEAPAWEGDAARAAPPEGQVQIDRGGGRNIISSFADAQRGGTERVAYAPELTGLAPTELLETIRNSTGSDDPRIAELNRQATELLMTQLREAGALDRTQMQVEGGLAQQQEATRGTLGAADIRARADRETGGQGRVIMGNERRQVGVDAFNQPIYETFSVPYDRFTGERIGEQKSQPQSKVSPDEYRGAVERLMAKKGYSRDDAVAYLKQQGIDAPR